MVRPCPRAARRVPSVLAIACIAAALAAAPRLAPAEVERFIEHLHSSGGAGHAVAVLGDIAYVSQGLDLLVVDLAGPAAPSLLRTLPLASAVADIAIADGRAYLSLTGDRRLLVLNVSEPADPTTLADIPLDFYPRSLAVDGSLVAATGYSGNRITLLDLTDLDNPVMTRGFVGTSALNTVAFLDGRLVVGGRITEGGFSSEAGFRIHPLPLSGDPEAAPAITISESRYGVQRSLLQGPRLYVARGVDDALQDRLFIYDLTAVDDPQLLGGVDIPAEIVALEAIDDAHVMVGTGNQFSHFNGIPKRVFVVDVSNPAVPDVLFEDGVPSGVGGLGVADGLAVASSQYGGTISVYDVSEPASAARAGRLARPGYFAYHQFNGTRMYAIVFGVGVQVFDLADPADPVLLHTLELPGDPYVGVNSGALLVVTDLGGKSVSFVDVWNAAGPQLLATAPLPFSPGTAAITGNRLYLGASLTVDPTSDEPRYTYVYDITNLASIQQLGSFRSEGVASYVFARGAMAILVSNMSPLQQPGTIVEVVDFSNPAEPQLVTSFPVEGASQAFLEGDRLYVAPYLGTNPTVRIYDVASFATPTLLSQIPLPGAQFVTVGTLDDTLALSIQVAGDDSHSEIRTFYLGDPTRPQLWGFLRTPGLHVIPALTPNAIVTGSFDRGLTVFRMTRPAAPANAIVAY